MIYIDTHAHLNYDNKYGDREQLIADICAAGIERVINVGWNYESSRSAALLAQKHERLYFAAGFHPSNLSDFCAGDHERIAALLSSPKGVAVGEIGLDYHYDGADEAAQKKMFAAQLELADGVMHCFSGSPETAKEYLKLGLYISFAGPVTFKNARRLDEVAKIVPADRLLAETDSPYLAPEPVRGTLNTPLNVVRVYEKLAALRGEDAEELALQIRKNAYTLFPKLKN